MATRSIYHKDCPSCGIVVGVDVKQCRCGYSFQTPEDKLLDEQQQALQDEALLLEYLSARLAQSVANLQMRQTALTSDPKNLDKANSVMRAFADVRQSRTELNTQAAKMDESKKAVATVYAEPVTEASSDTTAVAAVASQQQPTDAFRAAQSAKAEAVMKAAGMVTKACPKCRAVVPERAVLCFCGHTFAAHAAGATLLKHPVALTAEHRKII